MSTKRKGISTVLSDVLLILVTVLGMTALFAFTTGYFANFQEKQGSAIMEGLVQEDYWFSDNIDFPEKAPGIILNYYNYGKIELTITSLHYNNKPVDIYTLINHIGDPADIDNIVDGVLQVASIEIPQGQHVSIILKEKMTSGDESTLIIFTERTSVFEFWIWRP
ncbi:MAG: hypothetical protein ACTSQH_09165 [Candidatus Hodarchaeales archaeon]